MKRFGLVAAAMIALFAFANVAWAENCGWTISRQEAGLIRDGINKLFPDPPRCSVSFVCTSEGTSVSVYSSIALPYVFLITIDGSVQDAKIPGFGKNPRGWRETRTREIIEGVLNQSAQRALKR
jgi:hypothetical protein